MGIFKACSPVFIALIAAINLHQPLLAATPDSDVCLSVDLSANTGDSTIHGQQVMFRGGAFTMGSNRGFPEEQPARVATVGDFWIDAHEVTNAQFRRFVEATDYITSAERPPDPSLYPGLSADLLVPGSASFIKLVDRPEGQWREWWKFVRGANWQHPSGPDSDIDGKDNYPVVHVSHQDAQAYANWAGRAIPTEAQWEYAAQASAKVKQANTWQGYFPLQDKALDGFAGVAPVGCYNADDTGLYDMKGNVWEMVSDVFDTTAESRISVAPMRVIKGGSYLCAENHCQGDRPQSRQGQEEDFSSDNVGFRTVSLVQSAPLKSAPAQSSQFPSD